MTERRTHTASHDMFQLLVATVRDYAIVLLDPEGNIASWNEGARRIKGYEADEIVGQHFSVFYPAAEVKRGKPTYALRVAADEGHYEDEGWRIRKDGTQFWADVVITALRDETGALVGYAIVTRDLTEHRRREDERAQLLSLERRAREETANALERLRAIQSVTETALSHFSLEDLLPQLLRRLRDALAVDTAAVLLLSDEGDALVARAAIGLEEEVERNVRIPLGAGFAGRIAAERHPLVIDDVEHGEVLNPILRQKGVRSLAGVPLVTVTKLLGVLHVGTLRRRQFTSDEVEFLEVVAARVALAIEHARLYADAIAARTEADAATAAVKARDEFLSVAAHELKTPLTSAKAAAQLLQRSFERVEGLKAAQRRALDMIVQQVDKLSQLVTQLLETVRVQERQLAPLRRWTDVAALIRSAAEEAQATTTAHEIVVSAPDSLFMSVDPLRLEQVLTNLLSNAIKFSPNGGRVDVELVRPTPTQVWLTVRDRGLGVAPEHRPHIFERFYQAHGDRSGMGLGLYISRQIVEGHGGTIYAEFPEDSGARFVVSLPVGLHDVTEERASQTA